MAPSMAMEGGAAAEWRMDWETLEIRAIPARLSFFAARRIQGQTLPKMMIYQTAQRLQNPEWLPVRKVKALPHSPLLMMARSQVKCRSYMKTTIVDSRKAMRKFGGLSEDCLMGPMTVNFMSRSHQISTVTQAAAGAITPVIIPRKNLLGVHMAISADLVRIISVPSNSKLLNRITMRISSAKKP
ncbi:hypothetical protein I7I51_05118 [Histoplasma capsulatum]|uniref:Uncharacterized protein n=1 Tax=Ajellomyces capsulatus TaxID=5037 RepID=A0A8A1M4R1_AJECA|nr:hypothetical protein I7I51_05118 [Histoplasma capsulatum]